MFTGVTVPLEVQLMYLVVSLTYRTLPEAGSSTSIVPLILKVLDSLLTFMEELASLVFTLALAEVVMSLGTLEGRLNDCSCPFKPGACVPRVFHPLPLWYSMMMSWL